MGTWQLLSLVSLLIISCFILVIYIFRRTQRYHKKPLGFQKTNQPTAVTTVFNHAGTTPAIQLPDRLEILMEERKRIAFATNGVGGAIPGIVSEVKHNLSVAMTPQPGKLKAFQTIYWDHNHHSSDSIVSVYQEELTQVYTDIRLANIIVGLSKDLGYVSSEMEEGYFELCLKIAERLQKVASA